MRLFRIMLAGALLFLGNAVPSHVVDWGERGTVHAAKCTPYGQGACRACKNCRYCKHCAENGGTCSVCR